VTEKGESEEDKSLKQRIDHDAKEALKNKDSLRLGVLRMLKSEIRYKEIDKGSELSNDEVISVLSSSIKKRKDSIEQFGKGGRDDLVSQEKAELEVILGYMPEQLTEEKLSQIIHQAIEEANATGPSDLGKVMKLIMPQVKGKADGKVVNQMVSSHLQSILGSN
jgi:uncharacterized protein YqeY